MTTQPKEKLDRISYLTGYLDALFNFATYKDGRMYVGCGLKTYKEVSEPLEIELAELQKSGKEPAFTNLKKNGL